MKYNVYLTNKDVDIVMANGYRVEDGIIRFYDDISQCGAGKYASYIINYSNASYNLANVIKIISQNE
jgi:hypothetical protein